MDFSRAYKPGENIIILLLLLLLLLLVFFLPVVVSDQPTMSALFRTVTPTPFGWSSTTHFCNWRGVKCDNKNRVISLNLASHSLSGTLPSFANLSRLRHLDLHNNSFSTIHANTFSGLTALLTLSLSNNIHLSPWVFPSELAGSPQLTALYASNTNMIGSIPDIFSSFPFLVNLTLSYNNLTGSLPASFNSSSIQNLKLDNQKVGLTGNIDCLTGMNNLSVLWLHGNLFTGTIPTSLASLPNLVSVRLDSNKFLKNDTVTLNCRRCKVFIRVVAVSPAPPSYPSPKPSSGEKTNVGALVGFTILLVVFLLGLVVCVRCHSRRNSQRITTLQEQVVGKEQIAKVERDVDGKEGVQGQQPGQQLKDVRKKREDKEGLGQQLGQQLKDVRKKREDKEGMGQQLKDVRKKREDKEGMGQQLGQQLKDVRKKREDKEGMGQQLKDVRKKREDKEGSGQQLGQQLRDVKKKPENMERLGQQLWREEFHVMLGNRGNKAGKRPQLVVEEEGFSLKKFSYNNVRFMTNNFDSENVIGKGGFGRVYKGMLDGKPVAVKRLNQLHSRVDDYRNEVEALGRTSHFNLVKWIGYCVEDEHKMLVYEYMRNGPLQSWIFGTNPKKTLSWLEKKRIILGIAKGLVYLHENCEKKILHRDLKPDNVLLDDKKNAKLCDFGISKLLERDQSSTSTIPCGTPGYVAPEIRNGIRKISEKVDVYSFGVVVLEVIFGKRYYRLVTSNQTNLEPHQLPELMRKLSDEMWENGKDIERIGKLAVSCLRDEPEARPTMSDIVGALKGGGAKVGRY